VFSVCRLRRRLLLGPTVVLGSVRISRVWISVLMLGLVFSENSLYDTLSSVAFPVMFWKDENCTIGKKKSVEIEYSPVLLAIKRQSYSRQHEVALTGFRTSHDSLQQ